MGSPGSGVYEVGRVHSDGKSLSVPRPGEKRHPTLVFYEDHPPFVIPVNWDF